MVDAVRHRRRRRRHHRQRLSALLPSLGAPSAVQIGALVGSFLLEMGLIYLVITKYQQAGPEKLIPAIFFVVGLHFITMGLAHGPLIFTLGVLTCANAALAYRFAGRAGWRPFGFADALLKLGFGAWMVLGYPPYTYFRLTARRGRPVGWPHYVMTPPNPGPSPIPVLVVFFYACSIPHRRRHRQILR